MPLYQVIVLAVVQGLTEFLPVSSSAHLALVPWLFGWQDPGLSFDIALHLGTLAAVLIYFFKDWVQIIGQAFGLKIGGDSQLAQQPKLLWVLAMATIPAGALGFLFAKKAEEEWRSPWVIATMMIGIAIVMVLAEKIGSQRKDMSKLTVADAGAVGLAQALAIVPGTSRSGITIAAGLFRGLDRATAARFSFLLATPTIGGAALKAALDLRKHGLDADMRVPFVIGIIVSGIVGALVIGLFLKGLRKTGLWPFIYYRVFFGILVIALAIFFRYNGG